MKYSIIIPFYNTPISMLEKLFEQLLTLDKNVFEVIFINDGSKNSISEFAEKKFIKFKYIRLPKNLGVSHARNIGISQATGDYLIFVDADDLINIDLLKKIVTITHDDLSIFMTDIFYDNIETYDNKIFELENNKKLDYIYAFSSLKGIAMRAVWGKVFKKNIIIENNIYFNEELSFYEDAVFVCEYFNFVKNYHIFSNVLYHYRINNGGASKKFNKNYFEKYSLFYSTFERKFSFSENYMFALHSDAFNCVLVSKVIVAFKKNHYIWAIKVCKNERIIKSAKYLLENNFLKSKYQIKLARLIINGHNIRATNKIICHQIIGSLKIRFKRIFKH